MKRLILTIGLLMPLGIAEAAWVPPIGIPEPEFGIKEQAPPRPTSWPGASASGSYYIDNTHPQATDTANAWGYPDKPRLTIPTRLVVGANSLVEIHGGPYLAIPTAYAWRIDADSTNRPTAAAPAFVIGFNNVVIGVSQAAIDAKAAARIEIGITGLSYTVIEGIHFVRMPIGIVGPASDHVCIRDCESSGHFAAPISVNPAQGGIIHDIVFYNNRIHDTAYWNNSTADWDYHGIVVATFGRTAPTELYRVWVLDCTIYHCSGDAVQINGNTAGNDALHHIYIGRNTTYENRQSGFWCKQASDVVMSQNTIHTMNIQGIGLTGTGMGYQYGPDRLWLLFNEIYDCGFGIRQSDTVGANGRNAYIIGNYIHDSRQDSSANHWGSPQGWGISFWQGGMNRHVVNNTITNVHGGIEKIQPGPIYASNNLIYNLKPNAFPEVFGNYRNHIELASITGTDVDVDFQNCLVFGQAGGTSQQARIRWLGTQYTQLLSAQTAIRKLSGCVEADPLIDGMKLKAKSPAIDAGTQSNVYQSFQDLYGIDIRRDITGAKRPIGSSWDIGAYEYDPTAHRSIEAPKGLRRELIP